MSLSEKLLEDMKAAMKAGQAGKRQLEVIRFLRAAIKNAEIDRKALLTEDEVLGLVQKQVKQLKDSLEEFKKGDRADLIQKAEEEIAVLSSYLPQQMTEGEIRELARSVIQAVGATSARDMGKVMGLLVPRTKGRADGKLVNQVVKELLGS